MAFINITQQAVNGVASSTGAGVFYSPNPGYSGSDQFKYTITSDTGQVSNEATVTLNVDQTGVEFGDCEAIPKKHYQQQADDLMLAQFCGSDELIKLFRTKSKIWDNTNDILTWILGNVDIDDASCMMLDIIGKLVGQSRIIDGSVRLDFFGFENQPFVTGFNQAPFYDDLTGSLTSSKLSDEQYRRALKARVAANSSSVSMTGVSSMLKLLYDSTAIYLTNNGDASVTAYIASGISFEDQLLIRALLIDVVGAAIGFELIISNPEDTFGFEDQTPPYTGFNDGLFIDDLLLTI